MTVVIDMFSRPTIGERLAVEKAKRTHVSDIKDPMVRALWWKHLEWRNADIASECRPFPSEYGTLLEAAEREVEYARAARRNILSHLWMLRIDPSERMGMVA